MDAVLWANEGLVDMVVPCPFWTSSDFDIPVELWLERLGEAAERVTVAPGIEHNSRPWPGAAAVANDLAALRGFAASAYHRGADSLYGAVLAEGEKLTGNDDAGRAISTEIAL